MTTKGRRAFTVHADFFQSDFVPEVCLFSGQSQGLKKVQVKLNFGGKHHTRWYAIGIDRRTQRNRIIEVPAVAREHSGWSVWQALGPISKLLVFIFMLALTLQCVRLVNPFPGPFSMKAAIWEALLLFASGLLMAAARIKTTSGLVRILAAAKRGHVEIQFPAAQAKVFTLYQAAIQSWETAGRPEPQPKDRDEGWEDQAKAGWDQGSGDGSH